MILLDINALREARQKERLATAETTGPVVVGRYNLTVDKQTRRFAATQSDTGTVVASFVTTDNPSLFGQFPSGFTIAEQAKKSFITNALLDYAQEVLGHSIYPPISSSSEHADFWARRIAKMTIVSMGALLQDAGRDHLIENPTEADFQEASAHYASLAAEATRLKKIDALGVGPGSGIGEYRVFTPPDHLLDTIQSEGFELDPRVSPRIVIAKSLYTGGLVARVGDVVLGRAWLGATDERFPYFSSVEVENPAFQRQHIATLLYLASHRLVQGTLVPNPFYQSPATDKIWAKRLKTLQPDEVDEIFVRRGVIAAVGQVTDSQASEGEASIRQHMGAPFSQASTCQNHTAATEASNAPRRSRGAKTSPNSAF